MSAIGLGMRVVCIRKEPWIMLSGPSPCHVPKPVFGKIYEVARIETCESGIQARDAYLLAPGEVFLGFFECGDKIIFRSRNFRPLDGDIEMEMLRRIAAKPDNAPFYGIREPAPKTPVEAEQ